MKIAIVGSRMCGSHHRRMAEILTALRERPDCTEIISGGAAGIDSIAKRCAAALKLPMTEFLPDWKGLGKRAGFVRNRQIVEACDELWAWWDGNSRGTAHSISLAQKAGKPFTVTRVIL